MLCALGRLAVSLCLLGWAVGMGEAQTTLRLGNIYPDKHSLGQQAHYFAQEVDKRTGGKVKIQVFNDSVLGSEREQAEGVKAATLDLTISGLAGVGRFIQGIHVFELPYLYSDLEHLARVTDALFPDIERVMLKEGFRPLGVAYQGPRSIIAKRALRALPDMKGLKFRVPESPLYVGMARAMGAVPTPVAFPEVYTALQTGVAEAMEGGPDAVYNNKFYEQAKFFNLTQHIFHVLYIAMNEANFGKFPPDVQQALRGGAQASSRYQFELLKKTNEEAIQKMREGGVTIVDIKDLAPFRQAMAEFNKSYAERLGPDAVALLTRINAIK
jgi:tripartite ATP-independent transporter DctP family solute receptor